ncbi:RusA family crossover junction endodeoxyribonuclease [Tardiphaga robiniae]|uniref:RusA family crossover junction endodeoxyribonuclease n=2 Tax=Tardiphaga robiniae TaxID=943830 RepID=A0A7G6U959_9BRAD|nr:RusA family crossover junction endodeoxyribonuclease [Tardiphaga robiniae]
MTFPVEIRIDETPVSLQARAESKANWKDRVRRAVDQTLDLSGWATESPVAVTIFYFPDGPMIGDVDNIVKLILDGMKPRVYVDDAQVYRVVAQKFEPDEPSEFTNPTESLAAAIDADRPMVYIRIDSRSTQELQ